MKVFKYKSDLQKLLKTINNNLIIGFVPTMGALHKGHIKLLKEAKKKCNISIVSIFVNSRQFNNEKDFKRYPRNIDSDINVLKNIKCDILYCPDHIDLYEKNEKTKKFNFGTLTKNMEGRYRVGHFDGMATVVEKLLNIINPNYAFFGEKDLQQLQIVKSLVKQKKIDTKIIGIPTVRENNGLALSSRNKNLVGKNFQDATLIYKCLIYCKKNQHLPINKLKKYVTEKFSKHEEFKLDYIEFVDLKTLNPIKDFGVKKQNAICIAAYLNDIRLIDNIIL